MGPDRRVDAASREPVVETADGPAAELFGAAWPTDRSRLTIRHLRPSEGPVVVVGRSSPVDIVRDVPAIARVTGGGSVWLDDRMVWIDVWVPSAHARWSGDVGRAFDWIGNACKAGLASFAEEPLFVHRGPMVRHPHDRLVCWLGLGPGEVHDGDRRKVVGIAQRRTREGALFQIGALVAPSQFELATAVTPRAGESADHDAQIALEPETIRRSERGCDGTPQLVARSLLDVLFSAAQTSDDERPLYVM